ncbi:hypothetical protein JMJ35_008929 [Cladonia borealis]|uniref:Heterokaryon incompatibility domain-containing protein n=1 Tax=Cladonia borealis TaxID=184061 RepID=A0AA39QT36_9LECA|nr:hypothetical protein JMJ35_008929 [Cladonia borealis]
MWTRVLLLLTFLPWIWLKWTADYSKYDLLAAESEKYLSAIFGDDHIPIENAPASWLSPLYPPLNPYVDGLRVLIVAPASSGTIRCRTAVFTFSQQPRYRALSYEWGPPGVTLPILLNGVKVHLRENLWYALYHLRHSHDEVSLWTDVLCINQQNDLEKARLIPQMSMVYRRAEEVVVWLDNYSVPPYLQLYLPQMAKWQGTPKEIDWNYHTTWWDEAVPWLYRLIHARYWQRTWIIQEIGEAVRLKVHFAGGSLSWDAFVSAVHTFGKVFPYVSGTDRVDTLNNLRNLKRDGEIYSLSDLVCEFRDTFCSMPQDKLFAFLGMADDDSALIITAAYDQPLIDMYYQFLQYLSRSTLETVIKEVQIVHRSALLRYLRARKQGAVSYSELKPCSVDMKDDPYNYYYTTKDSNDKEFLQVGTDYRRKWKEWHTCTAWLQRSCWLPSAAESLQEWRAADLSLISMIKARGVLITQMEHIGPTITTFLKSGQAAKHWKLLVMKHFDQQPVQKSVIALNERMIDFITQSSSADAISSIGAFCISSKCPSEPARLFIGSNGVLGLTSPTAQVGDYIVQFFNSTSSAVVRDSHREWTIVGRAGVVKEGYSHDWDIIDDISVFSETTPEQDSKGQVVTLRMDINTLTQLNLNSIQLRDGNHHPDCRPMAPPDTPGVLPSILSLLRIWRRVVLDDYIIPFAFGVLTLSAYYFDLFAAYITIMLGVGLYWISLRLTL